MNNIEYLNYDENVDHLTIYKANETITSTIDTGLALLSLNGKKEIVGIELLGAHKNFKVPLEVLENIQGCTVEVQYNPTKKILIINITLKYQNKSNPIICSYENFDLGNTAFNVRFASASA